jgi:hypothetical protein
LKLMDIATSYMGMIWIDNPINYSWFSTHT